MDTQELLDEIKDGADSADVNDIPDKAGLKALLGPLAQVQVDLNLLQLTPEQRARFGHLATVDMQVLLPLYAAFLEDRPDIAAAAGVTSQQVGDADEVNDAAANVEQAAQPLADTLDTCDALLGCELQRDNDQVAAYVAGQGSDAPAPPAAASTAKAADAGTSFGASQKLAERIAGGRQGRAQRTRKLKEHTQGAVANIKAGKDQRLAENTLVEAAKQTPLQQALPAPAEDAAGRKGRKGRKGQTSKKNKKNQKGT